MNILNIDYTFKYKSLDIYFSGCKGKNGIHCKGCHNPSSWDFNKGEYYKDKYSKLESYFENNILIENIMFFGGEPMDQDINELIDFLKYLKKFEKKIWIFTRYDYESIPNDILDYIDYIKCGDYQENNLSDDNIQYNIKLASKNQKIFKVK